MKIKKVVLLVGLLSSLNSAMNMEIQSNNKKRRNIAQGQRYSQLYCDEQITPPSQKEIDAHCLVKKIQAVSDECALLSGEHRKKCTIKVLNGSFTINTPYCLELKNKMEEAYATMNKLKLKKESDKKWK